MVCVSVNQVVSLLVPVVLASLVIIVMKVSIACWVNFMILLSSVHFFQNQLFSKKAFMNTIRVPNSLDSGPTER